MRSDEIQIARAKRVHLARTDIVGHLDCVLARLVDAMCVLEHGECLARAEKMFREVEAMRDELEPEVFPKPVSQ